MCPVLRLFFSLLPIIRDYFLILSLIILFIIAIILFGSDNLLLFEGMAARSMRVGVSICSPLALELDGQVSDMACCVPSPT